VISVCVFVFVGNDSDAESVDFPENWEPDPIETTTGKPPLKKRASDLFALLVNVFGSKELFINE